MIDAVILLYAIRNVCLKHLKTLFTTVKVLYKDHSKLRPP